MAARSATRTICWPIWRVPPRPMASLSQLPPRVDVRPLLPGGIAHGAFLPLDLRFFAAWIQPGVVIGAIAALRDDVRDNAEQHSNHISNGVGHRLWRTASQRPHEVGSPALGG